FKYHIYITIARRVCVVGIKSTSFIQSAIRGLNELVEKSIENTIKDPGPSLTINATTIHREFLETFFS
ncbi:hypothetical protein J6590_095988, partial [Homalodisca vitripennis]